MTFMPMMSIFKLVAKNVNPLGKLSLLYLNISVCKKDNT